MRADTMKSSDATVDGSNADDGAPVIDDSQGAKRDEVGPCLGAAVIQALRVEAEQSHGLSYLFGGRHPATVRDRRAGGVVREQGHLVSVDMKEPAVRGARHHAATPLYAVRNGRQPQHGLAVFAQAESRLLVMPNGRGEASCGDKLES